MMGIPDIGEQQAGRYQPTYRFHWRDKLFWIYEDGAGYEIFGEDLVRFEKSWDNFVGQLMSKQNESTDENTDGQKHDTKQLTEKVEKKNDEETRGN